MKDIFATESVDVTGDLKQFFKGFIKNTTHPQLILCTLRNISREYKDRNNNEVDGFIQNEELTMLYNVINNYFIE